MRDISDYAATLGRTPEGLRLVCGQTADVVLDPLIGTAWRFPTSEQERQRLALHARRLAQVAALHLPFSTPQIRAVRVRAPLGQAHIEVSLIPGTPLSELPPLSPACRQRLAVELGAVLVHLRRADVTWIEFERSDWSAHWTDLAARVTASLLPRMSAEGRKRAQAELRKAVDLSRRASRGFIHGDLGGSNVLIDPSSGAVAGIVDWDSAGLGDPAVDVAALTTRLDVELAEEIVRSAEVLPGERMRVEAYRATFALQEALFGLEHGNDAALMAGLASYG